MAKRVGHGELLLHIEAVEEISNALQERHDCHTAILYGSLARGDWSPDSDYDVAGFGPCAETYRIAGPWRGSYLDLFVYPEEKLDAAASDLMHLRGGVVLFQRDNLGTELLATLERLHQESPERLHDSEMDARRKWAWKMLRRAGRGDAEGNFRRAWLLFALLEDFFVLRGMRYPGPKAALSWLEENMPTARAAFEVALQPCATLAEIELLVELVVGPHPQPEQTDLLLRTSPRSAAR